MRIALVDDNRVFIQILDKVIQEYFEKKQIQCQRYLFDNSQSFYKKMKQQKFDACFLDVEMPEMDGVTLARNLRREGERLPIVFLTAHSQYIRAGFEIKAFDYLFKDQIQKEVPEVLDRLLREISESKNRFYVIQNNVRMEKIPYENIVYIYKSGQNAVFVLEDGEAWERASLRDVLARLDERMFMKIERGFIINLGHIQQVNARLVTLSNGTEINASRELIRELKQRLMMYEASR